MSVVFYEFLNLGQGIFFFIQFERGIFFMGLGLYIFFKRVEIFFYEMG